MKLTCIICALLAACLSMTLYGASSDECEFGRMANGRKPTTLKQKLAVRSDLELKYEAAAAEMNSLNEAATAARVEIQRNRDSNKSLELQSRYLDLTTKARAKKDQVQAMRVALARLPKPEVKFPETLAAWKRVPAQKRAELFEEALDELDSADKGSSESGGKKFTVVELESWDNAVYDPFGKKILAAFKSEMGELPDTGEGQIRVGEPHGTVRVVRLADGTPIGGIVRMMQSGATHKDRTDDFHEDVPTWEAAKKAGFEDNDVSWSLTLKFNQKGEPLANQETYWDWSGH